MNKAEFYLFLIAGFSALSSALIAHNTWGKPQDPEKAAWPAVLVAARRIEAGSALNAGDVRWQALPPSAVLPQHFSGISATALPPIAGSVTTTAVAQGEPLSRERIVLPGSGGPLASLLAGGSRAVTIPLRDDALPPQLFAVNDRVDVIVHAAKGRVPPRLLRGLRVVAIGNSVSGAQLEKAGPFKSPRQRTLTVEARAADAALLAVNAANGRIGVMLNPAATISGAAQSLPPARAAGSVRVIRYGVVTDGSASQPAYE